MSSTKSSQSRRSEDTQRLAVDPAFQLWADTVPRNEVDLALQDRCQVILERGKFEQTGRAVKIDEDVDIAIRATYSHLIPGMRREIVHLVPAQVVSGWQPRR